MISVDKLKMFSPESEIFLCIKPKKEAKNFFVHSLDQCRRLEVREKARNVSSDEPTSVWPQGVNSSKSKKVRFYFPPLWRLNAIATNKPKACARRLECKRSCRGFSLSNLRARKLWFSHRVHSSARFGKRRRVLLALLWVLTMDTGEVTLVRFNRGKKVICVLFMKKEGHQTLKQRWRNQIRHWRQTRGLHPGDFQLTSLIWRIQ